MSVLLRHRDAWEIAERDASTIPWWAVALLEKNSKHRPLNELEHGARHKLQRGFAPHHDDVERWAAWASVVRKAEELAAAIPIEEWRKRAHAEVVEYLGKDLLHPGGPTTRRVRRAALSSVPSFAQWVEFRDDNKDVLVFEPFQIQTVNAIRQLPMSVILLPYEHGKTWLSSLFVPLMDWCEWHDATEGRVFWSKSHSDRWPKRLQQLVVTMTTMHMLFPWVIPPRRDRGDGQPDPAYGIWTVHRFAIAGRTVADSSYEALTASQFATGNRYSRIVCDDLVTTGNATSVPTQEKLFEYVKTGPLTFLQDTVKRDSEFGTLWPTFALCGTLFDNNDVGARFYDFFQQKGYATLKFDVYPKGREEALRTGKTLWRRVKPLEKVLELEERLGPRVFEMRCRNFVRAAGRLTFPRQIVDPCFMEEARWATVPDHTRLVIGFDPGSGKLTKYAKAPAFMVYGEQELHSEELPGPLQDTGEWRPKPRTHMVHWIEWDWMQGQPFTKQCDIIAERARYYQCPIVVEDNQTQVNYQDQMRRSHPDIRVETHTTGDNKRDPIMGVETYQPLFENRGIIVHTGHAPRDQVELLRHELIFWPKPQHSDLVMAAWIARYNAFLIRKKGDRPKGQRLELPGHARQFRFTMRPTGRAAGF